FFIEYVVLIFGVKIAVKERNEVIHRNLGEENHLHVLHKQLFVMLKVILLLLVIMVS
ncbi:hypothetical protein Gotur_033135, partial [Gossypium turneri]